MLITTDAKLDFEFELEMNGSGEGGLGRETPDFSSDVSDPPVTFNPPDPPVVGYIL